MADKHASEACALTGVGVQVSPPAQNGCIIGGSKKAWRVGRVAQCEGLLIP